jgi:hypothetical protein
LYFEQDGNKANPYLIDLFSFFLPMQGFWNFLVYILPALRQNQCRVRGRCRNFKEPPRGVSNDSFSYGGSRPKNLELIENGEGTFERISSHNHFVTSGGVTRAEMIRAHRLPSIIHISKMDSDEESSESLTIPSRDTSLLSQEVLSSENKSVPCPTLNADTKDGSDL